MKNIHVLPTDKPSRLRYNLSNILVLTKEAYRDYRKQVNQNIYITSDEEIKEGDWVLNSWNEIHQITKNDKSKSYKKTCKKIILTTDQDLIKDGVQAIDDEFLEWFCSKNGKVDFVEMKLLDAEEKLWEEYYKKNSIYPKYPWYYKIIIPKEKTKKIFDLPIATNLGSVLTETMKSVSQHEGGIKQGEINLPNFKQEDCSCTDECLGYLTKTCKKIEEPKQEIFRPYEEGQPIKVVRTGKTYNKGEHPYFKDHKIIEVIDNEGLIHDVFENELQTEEEPKQETLTNDTDSHSWGFENFEVIKTEEDAKIFVETIENIPEPNDKLKKAFKDFNKQETLEEFISEVTKNFKNEISIKCISGGIKLGAKWQMNKQDEFTLGFLHWYNTSQECETYLRRNYPKNITMNGEHYKKVLQINKELLDMYKNTLPR